GIEFTRADLDAAAQTYGRLYQALSRRNGTSNNASFEPADQVHFYTEALKLTALCHPNHTAWPAISGVRQVVHEPLLARLESSSDPWLALCSITTALASGAREPAARAYGL